MMIYWKYLKQLLRHKWYVFIAGRLIGVPFLCLVFHDWTKFMPIEFINYAQWHFGIKDKKGWASAWNHHSKHNPYHHEYWILSWYGEESGFYDGIGQNVTDFITILPMPETYIQEMVADLMGASKAYTGSWDISQWLNTQGPKMRLHDFTITQLDSVMCELGYFLADNCAWSWMAGSEFREWAKIDN